MTSIRSYFNRAIIRQDLKQYGWIGILYLLALILFIPFIMLFDGRQGVPIVKLSSLYQVAGGASLPLLIIFPVLAGTFIFRYLHAKAPSDLFHGLPITRSQLLTSHLFSALVLVTVPVWITAVITALIRPYTDYYYVYDLSAVWEFGVIFTVLGMFVCAFTILMAICFGQTLVQLVVTYGLLITPTWLILLGIAHIKHFLFGFHNYYFENGYSTIISIEKLTPLLRISGASTEPFGWFELTLYFGLAVIFLILGYLLYRKRDGAAASHTVVYRFLTPIFMILVMLFCSLVAGLYMSSMKENGSGMLITGYILGGIFGFLLVQMVLHRTWLVFHRKTLVHGILYGMLLAVIMYIPVSNVGGYESRVPEPADVKGVLLGDVSLSFVYEYDRFNSQTQQRRTNLNPYFTDDQEYAAAIMNLHKALVDNQKDGEVSIADYTNDTQAITIGYELKNGHRMMRKYVFDGSKFEAYLKPIMENDYYKKQQYTTKELNEENTSRIVLTSSYSDKNTQIIDPKDIKQFKELLLQEVMNMSYEDQINAREQNAWAYVELQNFSNKYGNYRNLSWNKSFKKLTAWMEQKGYADKVRLVPSDISAMTITRNINNTGFTIDPNVEDANLEYYSHMAKLAGETRVTKDDDKAKVLQSQKDFSVYADYSEDEAPYLVLVKFNNGQNVIWTLKNFPDELK
ncbi:hypothetical protein [Paenibacillus sp. Marseille-Q4541]|uniref:hypothetical protein n=1 Tax=Paenibacillus sp. Marseille-Q4541 TaxID=2831522 RepID=UPI001BA4C196|nr:hypothetical protein [Paenibacillus sp. Marseille-Q4541]